MYSSLSILYYPPFPPVGPPLCLLTFVSISFGSDVLLEEPTGFVHLALDLFIPIERRGSAIVGVPYFVDYQFTTGAGEPLALAQRFQFLPIRYQGADQRKSPGAGRVVVPSGPTNGFPK